jgi:hypothetical protein
MEIHRLPADDRFEQALKFRGLPVEVETVQNGNRMTFRGWVTSVANLRNGNTPHVLVLRTDQDRIDKDLAFSLAQVARITGLPLGWRPTI